MSSKLDEWQERLERHFLSLANLRRNSGFPIFALEHGRSDEELEEISMLFHSRLESGLPLSPHWLLWVIYTTECGYGYTGDEYWRSFEEQTPFWESKKRCLVIHWFKKFQIAYNGFTPSGLWASYFRIIAWPITHAILPSNLQRKFAQVLYNLRFRLAGLETHDAAAIGRFLAAEAYDGVPTRFSKFLEQEELTGRIVLGFLGETPREGEEPIYPPTLRRIVNDLESVQRSREWLKETQRVVGNRFKGIGRGIGHSRGDSLVDQGKGIRDAFANPDIRPNLLLRYVGSETWSVVLEIPSFRSIGALSEDLRTFLKSTRCNLNGGLGKKPTGWLLSGKRKGILKTWPNPQKPLIQFEQSNIIIDRLLEGECRISDGPVWLFRVGYDGIAREIKGLVVRPSYEYIILSLAELPVYHKELPTCNIDCTGINSCQISIPNEVSEIDIAWIETIGLQIAKTIHIWPAGFLCRGWDGEGNSEWLTTESACFGVVHDHPVDGYVFRLNAGSEFYVKAGEVGEPVFIKLLPLPAGKHTLKVVAIHNASIPDEDSTSPASGFIELKVREPEPWIPGIPSHRGLVVSIDPYDAGLDYFWGNKANLSIMGPTSHSVSIALTLRNPVGEEVLSEKISGQMKLPINAQAWRSKFVDFVKKKKNVRRYLEASYGRLTIDADELGKFILRFERELEPIRWVLREEHGDIFLRLIDDTDQENIGLHIDFFDMENPIVAKALLNDEAISEMNVYPPGGLFVVKRGEHRDAIVVSTFTKGSGLKELGINPDLNPIKKGIVTPESAIRILELWCSARLSGFLPDVRRQKVRDEMCKAIYEIFCGLRWLRAEIKFMLNLNSQNALEDLVRIVGEKTRFANELLRNYIIMCDDIDCGSDWFAIEAKRNGICSDNDLCKLALVFASEPHSLLSCTGERINGLLKRMKEYPKLLRGSRLLALLCANRDRTQPALLLPEWKW